MFFAAVRSAHRRFGWRPSNVSHTFLVMAGSVLRRFSQPRRCRRSDQAACDEPVQCYTSLLPLLIARCAGLVSRLTPRFDPQLVSAQASDEPDDRHDHDDAE